MADAKLEFIVTDFLPIFSSFTMSFTIYQLYLYTISVMGLPTTC